MLTSLIDSHPDISCRFGDSDADVGVFHFHNVKWKWLDDPNIKKVLLERGIVEGSISEMVSPHGQRADGRYHLTPESVQRVAQRRRLYTELLRPYADLVLNYETITNGGEEVYEWQSDELCDLLGVSRRMLTCSMRKLLYVRPKNVEELRAGTIA